MKYDVIYADPPWPMKKSSRKSRPNQVAMDYPTMSVDEIKNMGVSNLSSDNSVLFLWATHFYLPDAFEVLKAWGFKYQRTITWDKQNGMCLFGFHHRTEFLLFGYKGNLPAFPVRKAFPTIIQAKSSRHSAKPQIIRDLIVPFGENRIELFAREKIEGWDVWGNEVDSSDNIRALIEQSEPSPEVQGEAAMSVPLFTSQTSQQPASQVDVDAENTLRISKSGYSVKLGWKEKRIIACAPNNACTPQWLEDAQRLCDGWNSLLQSTRGQ